jgi:DNA-binding MarR family transcriptional regulator
MQLRHAQDEAELALQALRRLVHGIRSVSYSVERSCGVTGAQLFVLRELSLEPAASIRRLSERTLTDPSSVSVIVARLVARGLVTRTRDDADRRKSALALSSKGAQLLARAPEPYQGRLIGVLRALPRSQLGALRAALSSLSDALGLTGGAPLFFERAPPRKRAPRGSK